MPYPYPYKSKIRNILTDQPKAISYRLWQSANLSSLLASIQKPVVEIGGPTQDGFYFLDGVEFNTKPIITNITRNPAPLSPDAPELSKGVDEVVDAAKMPYADNSIGVFLMSGMSLSSDWWVELPEAEKEKASAIFENEYANARFEMGQVAAGTLDPRAVKDAQRIKIYLEVSRCLDRDGLFFTDGGLEEITILQRLGFELVAYLQVAEDYGISYEFIVTKQ